jgi:hypothetical protein
MSNVAIALAKLAGINKAVKAILEETNFKNSRPITNFSSSDVGHYFSGTVSQLAVLKENVGPLYGDFTPIQDNPEIKMSENSPEPFRYGREQLMGLARAIDQIFELRANSELAAPEVKVDSKIFISHGRANDWREVQEYIERDLQIKTLELAQEPNCGRTILQKLEEESSKCNFAVIVMTGDDLDADGYKKARENVMHEIGYFQGKFGLSAVCLLHEEGTSIPSNIQGLVYIPFPKGYISATLGVLMRELKVLSK